MHEALEAKRQRLGIADVERRLGRNRATLWRWYRNGLFPAPHFIGELRAWWLDEIEAWEAEQMSRPRKRRREANFRKAAQKAATEALPDANVGR